MSDTAMIGTIASVALSILLGLLGWSLRGQVDDLKSNIKDHETRLREQESGKAIKEMRDELREDFLRLSQVVQASIATNAQQLTSIRSEVDTIRHFGNPSSRPGG